MSKDKFDFSEEFRTSRVQTIARGELFWTEVDILDLSDTQTANVLKATLENYGIKTNYFPAALAEHLKKVLGGSDYAKAPYLIIAAHGAEQEGSLHMDTLADELAATQDFHGQMTPEDLSKFVDVKDKVVINVACVGGEKELAKVFIEKGGAKAYIAETSSPFHYVSSLFPTLLFYFLTNYTNLSLAEAFERAKAADAEEFKSWKLFE
ncbi:hypothetical protein IPO96_03840 [Candidatus Saccharibacteria bacterium]|nr:MAG: hypothetical protein IPO96_03840 [Candidatus Saccharibacteria bacterium]